MHNHLQSTQNLERLKAAHNAGDMVVLREEVKGIRPRHHRDVSRQEEAVNARLPAIEERTHHGRDELLRGEQKEVLAPLRLCCEHRRSLGWRGRFKSDGKEYNLLARIFRCDRECVERRVDDADIRALCLCLGKAGMRARHLQHIAERCDDDIRHPRIRNRRVDVVVRRHADRAAGPRDQLDALGQNLPQSRAKNRNRVRTADLHNADALAPCRENAAQIRDNLRGSLPCVLCAPHGMLSTVRGAPRISARSASMRSASS